MTTLYKRDFFGWTQDQADALRRRSINELDWENLVEEVESMGKQERSELQSRLVVLLTHLLKWRHQPERRTRSWALTIVEQRLRAQQVLDENPSLKPEVQDVITTAYRLSRIRAARETRRPIVTFPSQSEYDWDAAMTEAIDYEGL